MPGAGLDALLLVQGAWLETVRGHARVSLHDPASALVRLTMSGRLGQPDADWAALLRVADVVQHAAKGRFDPTAKPLWRALAEGRDIATV